MKSISIFTGAGGLDIGMERAGFHTISAVEIHPIYFQTLCKNQESRLPVYDSRYYFQDTQIINDDIRNLSGQRLMDGENDIDCLVGGPPCQAFSSAGKQRSIFDDRGSLIYEYLRILKEIMPRTFLFENVRGLITARGHNNEPGEVLQELLTKFFQLGYNCSVSLLNAADYGSYQRRVRCFILGSKIGPAPDFPTPTHSSQTSTPNLFENALYPWLTLNDFLKNHFDQDERNWVRPTQSLWEKIKDCPGGSGIKSLGKPETTRPNGHWGYRQGTFIADLTKPARTVTGSSSQDWIRLDDGSLRRLTFEEVKLLQGFPPEWIFCGSKANKFQQVGNAVPIIFGHSIGTKLIEYLNSHHESHTTAVEKVVIPDNIKNAIKYTKRDYEKNGSCRIRFPHP